MDALNPPTVAAVSGTGETFSLGYLNGAVSYQSFDGAKHIVAPQRMHQGAVRSLRYSADGRLLASGGEDRIACVIDVNTGTGRQFVGHQGTVTTIDASDRGVIATGSGDHTVRIWDMANVKELKSIPHPMGVTHLSFAPRGHMLATAGPAGVIIWDGNDWKDLPVIKDASVKLVRFSRDGSRMATVTAGNLIRVWDTSRALDSVRLTMLAERTEGANVNDVAFNFIGERLGICRGDGILTVWNHVTKEVMQPSLAEVSVPLKIWTMDFAADGGFLPVFTARTG